MRSFFVILCCKTEHKTQLSFSQRQKILKCLWSKNFELQKCGHTGKLNYGLNLSIILMFLTIYGVEKSQCDRSKEQFLYPIIVFVATILASLWLEIKIRLIRHTKVTTKIFMTLTVVFQTIYSTALLIT